MNAAVCQWSEDGDACEGRPAFALDLPSGRFGMCAAHLADAAGRALEEGLAAVRVLRWVPPRETISVGQRSAPVGGTKSARSSASRR